MPLLDRDKPVRDILNRHAQMLSDDYAPVVNASRNRKFILVGEASHGTAEFYRIRADITKQLIEQGLCDAVAVEADWPDAWRVNRYVTGRSEDEDGMQALGDFERFPTWMWRNTEVLDFVDWLHDWNAGGNKSGFPVGFYGLDLYSLNASIASVIKYLDTVDPAAGKAARERYGCFGGLRNDPQSYGYASASGILDSCEKEAVTQLLELQKHARRYLGHDGAQAEDDFFSAQQNAEIVQKAEEYYRAMYRGFPDTWNLRDRHMFTTLERLHDFLSLRREREACIVVWAHNSHLGNAAATRMGKSGEFNIGQLAIEKYGEGVLNVGFSTSNGTVTAASQWDAPMEVKMIRPPLHGSYEALFSGMKEKRFLLDMREPGVARALREERLQRAIGVIYRPETERQSHYFEASLAGQFNMLIHLEETTALQGLPAHMHMRRGDLDETYPFGL